MSSLSIAIYLLINKEYSFIDVLSYNNRVMTLHYKNLKQEVGDMLPSSNTLSSGCQNQQPVALAFHMKKPGHGYGISLISPSANVLLQAVTFSELINHRLTIRAAFLPMPCAFLSVKNPRITAEQADWTKTSFINLYSLSTYLQTMHTRDIYQDI